MRERRYLGWERAYSIDKRSRQPSECIPRSKGESPQRSNGEQSPSFFAIRFAQQNNSLFKAAPLNPQSPKVKQSKEPESAAVAEAERAREEMEWMAAYLDELTQQTRGARGRTKTEPAQCKIGENKYRLRIKGLKEEEEGQRLRISLLKQRLKRSENFEFQQYSNTCNYLSQELAKVLGEQRSLKTVIRRQQTTIKTANDQEYNKDVAEWTTELQKLNSENERAKAGIVALERLLLPEHTRAVATASRVRAIASEIERQQRRPALFVLDSKIEARVQSLRSETQALEAQLTAEHSRLGEQRRECKSELQKSIALLGQTVRQEQRVKGLRCLTERLVLQAYCRE